MLKGAGSSRGNDHAVDAISGGTITSRAVENMIRATLEEYLPYIEQQKGEGSPAESEPTTWSTVELTPEVETNNTVEDESK